MSCRMYAVTVAARFGVGADVVRVSDSVITNVLSNRTLSEPLKDQVGAFAILCMNNKGTSHKLFFFFFRV